MSNDASSARPGAVQSVGRAIQVLEVLAREGECGVTQLATELGVHKSTAFRLVAALETGELVEQDAQRGKYRLGMGILRLAGATTARLDVVQEARPLARDLASDLAETVNIVVLHEDAALYLDQLNGSSVLPSHNWVGQRIPLHATSNGKVLLSGLSDEQIRKVVGRRLQSFTPDTVTNVHTLLEQVEKVREQGHAVVIGELEVGLTAIAAPLRNAHGDVIASLSASGPSFRFDDALIERAIDEVTATAREVSARLGWRG